MLDSFVPAYGIRRWLTGASSEHSEIVHLGLRRPEVLWDTRHARLALARL